MSVELTSTPTSPSHFRGSPTTQAWPPGTSPDQRDWFRAGHGTPLKPTRLDSGTSAETVGEEHVGTAGSHFPILRAEPVEDELLQRKTESQRGWRGVLDWCTYTSPFFPLFHLFTRARFQFLATRRVPSDIMAEQPGGEEGRGLWASPWGRGRRWPVTANLGAVLLAIVQGVFSGESSCDPKSSSTQCYR